MAMRVTGPAATRGDVRLPNGATAEARMSDITTTGGPESGDEAGGQTRMAQAKDAIGQAGQALKAEAQSFADVAQQRARDEAQKHTETATRTLGDFANAVRKAGDELGAADQSPAARLVRQAADGLEGLSRNLEGKRPEELLDDVRAFGRKSPVAFIGGAVLVGVALGRFIRASEGAGSGSYSGGALGSYAGGSEAQPYPADTGAEALPAPTPGAGFADSGVPDLTAAQGPAGVEASVAGGITDSTDSAETGGL
jgi:hypothetical protein